MKLMGTNFWLGSLFSRWQKLLVIGMTATALGACGGGGGGGSVAPTTAPALATYTIGGTVSGLSGTLILQNNGGDNLSLSADGSVTFSKALASGAAYVVSVLTQPSGQNCTVSSGSGTATANVNTVAIQCTYTVGGTVSGLSGTLVLQNNGGNDLSLSTDGTFSFSKALSSGAAYAVTVLTQPSGQLCTVSSDSGTSTSNVTTVSVQCIVQWKGTKQLGVAGAGSWGQAVATDASGNVYVAGTTSGGLDGSSPTGTPSYSFVTKYNRSGDMQYTYQLGGTAAPTWGHSIATDGSGNVYVTGHTLGGLDGNRLTGTSDFFVTKYNSSGVKQFTQQLGVAKASTSGSSVATDASGNVYVAGTTAGGLDNNTLTGTYDFFITKYNSSGVKQFTRQLGVKGTETWGHSVATDASGNIYMAGWTSGGLDGNALTGTTDLFLTKYDSNGAKQFTRQLGVAGAGTWGNSVATDANGNVYVAGFTSGGLDGNKLIGTTEFFVTKYDSSGAKLYTRQLGVAGGNTYVLSVAIDASANIYVTGDTSGGLDGNTRTGTTDFFVTKYNSSGVKQ
jgi:hypothetical protein